LTALDAGLPGFVGRLEADLAAFGHAPSDVDAVVLTHGDSDHTGVAAVLQAAGARVLIHVSDEAALRTGKRKSTDGNPLRELLPNVWRPTPYRFITQMVTGGGAKPTTVDGAETFADGDVLDVPGHPRIIATPGHTPGHCAIHFEEHQALFVGDELCTLNPLTGNRDPQVMPALTNVSTPQCFESLARLESIEAAAVLPGHGEPWRGGVAQAIASARSLQG
jgi:glyoxylase-like metal-dependent hydrolase (beta-lactamase superfamily II)